jgi:hypothetical protein
MTQIFRTEYALEAMKDHAKVETDSLRRQVNLLLEEVDTLTLRIHARDEHIAELEFQLQRLKGPRNENTAGEA